MEGGNNMLNSKLIDSILFNGESTNNYFGFCVSSAGDVIGNGFSDVITYSYTQTVVKLYFRNVSMNNVADVVLTGDEVFSARDVN